jgi:hypothetical protein
MSSISADRADGILSETFNDRSMDLPYELLNGAIDIHVHAGPHLKSSPRRLDPFQAAIEARDAGMRGLVYMDVFKESAGTAWIVKRHIPDIDVFGGIILSSNYDGINPRAVKTALNYGVGAKFVSFGAHSTHYLVSREGQMVDGAATPYKDIYPEFAREELSRAVRIPLADPLPAELQEILGLLAEHPEVYLNTGHVSVNEALRLIEIAHDFGIKRVLVAHFVRKRMTIAQQQQAVRFGTFLESAFADHVYPGGIPRTHYYVEKQYQSGVIADDQPKPTSLGLLADEIRAIGPQHFILCSDYGIRGTPTPVEGMRQFIAAMLDLEFSVADIQRMVCHNPAQLLDLEPL